MDYYQNMIQATNEKNSFMLHNGIRLTKMERDHAVVEADLTRVNRNLYGAVHGGMFLTMADCASGGAARSNGMRYVTVSNSFEFFRNTKDDHLIAEGWGEEPWHHHLHRGGRDPRHQRKSPLRRHLHHVLCRQARPAGR